MRNKLNMIGSLLLSTPVAVSCNTTLEIFCFTSGETSQIQFEMRDYTDQYLPLNYAFIKYRNSKKWIPLVSAKVTSLTLNRGTQEEITSSWLEIVNNTPSGTYEMTTQGTTINSMRYTNFSTKKTYSFIRDPGIEFSSEKGCAWK